MRTAPYGSWLSPLSAAALTASRVHLHGATMDADSVYWAQSSAQDAGRTSVWRSDARGRVELTPGDYVRDGVHEYGGGPWAVRDGVLVYSTFPSHQTYVLDAWGRRPLTPANPNWRYGGFAVRPELGVVLAVREDHTDSDLDCRNELVALRLNGDNPGGGVALARGADFYGAPAISAGMQVAWVEWDHPNMPWDATRLMVGTLAFDLEALSGVRQIAGPTSPDAPASAPCYPRFHGEDVLYLDDTSGFWNFHRFDGLTSVPVHREDADFCGPAWTFGGNYHVLADGRIACLRFGDGVGVPGLISEGRFAPLAGVEDVAEAAIGGSASELVLVLKHLDAPPTLQRWRDGVLTKVLDAEPSGLTQKFVSPPTSITWEGPDGVVQGFHYPPRNPQFEGPEGELPPLKVLSHGGPTGSAYAGFDLGIQYWTSRGWAVLDVNYGGSAGFGRAYRERLRGRWGVSDVRDCADGVRAVVGRGLADSAKVAIEGGSAGGFTTLAALTTSDVFAAGNCLYGIADLAMLAAETHKFESRYLFGLLGGTPEEIPEVYRDRSPLWHLDSLSCPMLIQQGSDDKVVPPTQALAMAEAVRSKGLPVALLVFEGEGHGFRKAENIIASVEAAASFYGQVFGFEVPGVPRLAIENLDA